MTITVEEPPAHLMGLRRGSATGRHTPDTDARMALRTGDGVPPPVMRLCSHGYSLWIFDLARLASLLRRLTRRHPGKCRQTLPSAFRPFPGVFGPRTAAVTAGASVVAVPARSAVHPVRDRTGAAGDPAFQTLDRVCRSARGTPTTQVCIPVQRSVPRVAGLQPASPAMASTSSRRYRPVVAHWVLCSVSTYVKSKNNLSV